MISSDIRNVSIRRFMCGSQADVPPLLRSRSLVTTPMLLDGGGARRVPASHWGLPDEGAFANRPMSRLQEQRRGRRPRAHGVQALARARSTTHHTCGGRIRAPARWTLDPSEPGVASCGPARPFVAPALRRIECDANLCSQRIRTFGCGPFAEAHIEASRPGAPSRHDPKLVLSTDGGLSQVNHGLAKQAAASGVGPRWFSVD
jgi:hypothetical protein